MHRKFAKVCLLIASVGFFYEQVMAQKAPLDHQVYDGWQSITTSSISKNGKSIYYVVSPQEGDATLYVKDAANKLIGEVGRPSLVQFSPSESHLLMLIKPLFQQTRTAKIQKKKPIDMPKDSLGVFELSSGSMYKFPAVKSYKAPEKAGEHIAFLADQPTDSAKKESTADQVLYVYHLKNGVDTSFLRVDSYEFSQDGKHLYFVRTADKKDSIGADAGVFYYDLQGRTAKQLSSGKGTYKQLAVSEQGNHLAFLAYKGSDKALLKSFALYHYNLGQDSAQVLVDQRTAGMPNQWFVGEHRMLKFSNDGKRVFFGIAPIPPVKDTTLVEFEHAKLDIWHWKEDYLQPQQLVNLKRDQNKSYLAVVNLQTNARVIPLSDEQLDDVRVAEKGDQQYALGLSDYGRRVESQWLASTFQDVFLVSTTTGERTRIAEQIRGSISFSPEGRYAIWFDRASHNWYSYDIQARSVRQLNEGINVSFADENNDSPDDPSGYGIAGWTKQDGQVLINDKYDIWLFDLKNNTHRNLTNGFGRANNITLRYRDLKNSSGFSFMARSGGEAIDIAKSLWLSAFNQTNKENGWFKTDPRAGRNPSLVTMGPFVYGQAKSAEHADLLIYTKENYEQSPNLYVSKDFKQEMVLSATNPQQANYNWGTASLYEWTTPNGHAGQGILYKPEDFDPNKKYPVISYFYEILSDGLYSYIPPSPTPSRLNISYFVSNGYLVFAPDIIYDIGYPGRSAEEYINSGMQELAKLPYVDETKLAVQGQSWGGYQVAHLITRTNMYAAAWSGAPVVNMTSAYGGIRWQTGMNRQFQYEHTQSRIGATLWEDPALYIENSPLFHLPNVNTPVVIMHNDEDGAVPWYQGIEMFTALRRLNKPVWMLNYNGEAHNLVQRQNRKDIQRRQQEFFDHFLKGKPAAPWIETGVPAVRKGIDWGFGNE